MLNTVCHQDGEERRPLFYKLSHADMVVPYGEVRASSSYRCARGLIHWSLNPAALPSSPQARFRHLRVLARHAGGESSRLPFKAPHSPCASRLTSCYD